MTASFAMNGKYDRIRLPVIFLMLTIASLTVSGQRGTTCPNSDFSQGTFANWEGYYGRFDDPSMYQGIIFGRHTIITSPGTYDFQTCDSLFTLPPGCSIGARLGNASAGAEAEQLRYSLAVTAQTNLFIYKYAVVLEDPGHVPEHQPSFTIEVADRSGNLIDTVCGYYYVYAHQQMPTWHSCKSKEVVWKDWTTVGIDLTPYIGQNISIVFTTRDCSERAHFGYAYISAYCSRLEIRYGFCPDDTVAYVTAPPGFSYLWDTGDTTQVISITHPVPGETHSCVLTSVNGCKVNVSGAFRPIIIRADFETSGNCVGSDVEFTDKSTINEDSVSNWKWDFGDGSDLVYGLKAPVHIYSSPGSFTVKMVAYSDKGCPDSVSKILRIGRVPVTDFTITPVCGVLNSQDAMYFEGSARLSVPGGYTSYLWNTGDTTSWVQLDREGWYAVTVTDSDICSVSDSVLLQPCYFPCNVPNAFTPDGDGLNDRFRPVTTYEILPGFDMIIFDRWGRQIFESHDAGQGWDGKINGLSAQAGSFAYRIIFQHPSGVEEKRDGVVTLVK